MAKQEIVEILLKLSDGNTIPLIAKKAKKAKKEMEGLGGAAQGTDRRIKGVTQQSSGASKNFSKQAQTMQGGIVAVYATIAAQVFAVSAAFQFLKDAMETRNLIEGQLAFGAVTGVAYKSLTTNIQAAAGGMIQFREAAQAAAIGTAGGLSAHQLERLGEAALNTSLALGRDLTDSFNRLVRGVTKAEPELLDELGIILRLEPALKNYAALIGKAVKDLNQFEKSQAIANEVLDQAESKFGMMSLLMDDSAFALQQFQKSFDDVMNNLKKWVGDVAGKVLPFFTDNIMNLVGAIGLFLAPILKSLLPDFKAMAIAKRAQADEHVFQLEREKAALDAYKAKRAEVAAQENKLRGTAGPELDAAAAKVGMKGGMRGKHAAIAHYERQTTALVKGEIKARTGALAAATPKEVALLKQKYLNMNKATASWSARTKVHWQSVQNWSAVQMQRMRVGWERTMATMTRIGQGFASTMNFAMRAMGWASIILMIYQGIKALKEWRQGVDEARKAEIDFYKEVEERYSGLRIEFDKMADARRRGFVMGENIISQTGKILQSADLPKLLKDWNLLMQSKPLGIDTEALDEWKKAVLAQRHAMYPLMALTLQMQDAGMESFLKAFGGAQLPNVSVGTDAIVTDEQIQMVTRWGNEWLEAGNFIDTAAERNKTLAKSIQEVANAAGSEKFARVLDEAYQGYEGLVKLAPSFEEAGIVDAIQAQILSDAEAMLIARKEEMANYLDRHDPTGIYQERVDVPDQVYNEQTSLTQRAGLGAGIPFGNFLGTQDPDSSWGQKMIDTFKGIGENAGGLDRFRREFFMLRDSVKATEDSIIMINEGIELGTEQTITRNAETAKAKDIIDKIWTLQKSINTFENEKLDIGKETIKLNGRLMSFSDTTTKNHKEDIKLRTSKNTLLQKENNLLELTTAASIQSLDYEQGIKDYRAGNWEDLFGNYTKEERQRIKQIMFAQDELELGELKVELTREQIADAKILNDIAWENKKLSYTQALDAKQILRYELETTQLKEKAVGYEQHRVADQRKINSMYSKGAQTLAKMVQAEKNYTDYTAERTEMVNGVEVTLANNVEKVAELEKLRKEQALEYLKVMKEITNEAYKQSAAYTIQNLEDETSKGRSAYMSRFANERHGTGIPGWRGSMGAWGSAFGQNAYGEERGKMGYGTDAEMIAGENKKLILAEKARRVSAHFADRTPADISANEIAEFEKSLVLTKTELTAIQNKADNIPTALRKAAHESRNFAVELELAESIEKTIENGFVSMFQSLVDGTKSFGEAMKDLMKQVLADLAAAYLKAAAMKFMMSMGIGAPPARYGGILSSSGKSFAAGGIARGPGSGYMATLHGTEAVVPLGNDRSIPVQLLGSTSNTVNVAVNISGQGSSVSTSGGAAGDAQALGRSIGGLVQQHLQQEMRPGGLLNRQGATGRGG